MPYNEKLRKLRMVKGLTRSDVERKAGISYSCIKELENGISNPTIFTLEILCKFYGVELWQILSPEWEVAECGIMRVTF